MLRFLVIPLLLLLLSGCHGAASHPVTKIDPSEGGQYDGNRGADEMVIYTPAGPRKTTGTNRWGTEAVVVDGIVHRVGDNDQPVPSDGFVVSGHGVAAEWINANLHPGTAVSFDRRKVFLDESTGAQVRAIDFQLNLVREDQRRRGLSVVTDEEFDALRERIAALKADPSTKALKQIKQEVQSMDDRIWEARLLAMPSPAGEVRAVWCRLKEQTPEELARLAEEWRQAGVNVAFPETIYASQSIYPEPSGLYTHFPQFNGTDALAVLVEECHKRGIEVHAWVHCFFIGIEGNPEEPPLLAPKHPDWLAQDRKGRKTSAKEQGFYFLNPAHPEVRTAMINAYVEMAQNYAIDGFQFDYIRYCSTESWEEGWDYSDLTREMVRRDLGFDPLEITPTVNPEQWKQWMAWRERTITTFVQQAGDEIRRVRPGIILSADVFPDLGGTIESKGQNWADWGRRGYVDTLIPMCYTTSEKAVADSVRELDQHLPDRMPLVIGLGPYLKLNERQIMEQIETARSTGSTGQCLFDWPSLTPAARHDLGRGPWRTPTKPAWKK